MASRSLMGLDVTDSLQGVVTKAQAIVGGRPAWIRRRKAAQPYGRYSEINLTGLARL
jgi:hypothetical protein